MAPLDDQAKLAAVGDVLEALTLGNLPALQRRLSDDVVLDAQGQHRFAGTFSGPGEVLAYAATSSRNFDVATTSIERTTVEGDTVTLVLGVDLLIRDGSWRTTLIQSYRFDQEGLIDWIEVRAEDPEAFERMADQTRVR